ncbi:type IV pilus biogenesis protein PilM [Hydrogenophaga sp. BPS33]|uniref:type IV pilus biogenesis protein PilM n=1 Tax=Hydrogenophaga sp. BPS33 TaxID=2651974 RepID=UPI00131F4B89|nr:type IV pilus biogenesis protein PilM [Hydrogenophaga sp. BPS33]QHE89333.1 type IV pilus biogenesis protein PilM [Hydrogenophaga sp. BPS33]
MFLALVMFFTGKEAPRQAQITAAIQADSSATSFLAYGKAVRGYLNDHPTASGSVDDAALAAYFLPGYIRDDRWTNLVEGTSLYVFATDATEKGTVVRLFELSQRSVLVGAKNQVTGRLISANGFDTGIDLPAAIPNNAAVMMGR